MGEENKETTALKLRETDLVAHFAEQAMVTSGQFYSVAKDTLFGKDADKATDAQLCYLLIFCKKFGFDPLSGGLHAFLKGGAVHPLVEHTQWASYAKELGDYKGFTYEEKEDKDGKLLSIVYTLIDGADNLHVMPPTFMSEWFVASSEIWKKMPRHMLHIKAFNNMIKRHYGITAIDPIDKANMERTRSAEEVSGLRQELEVKVDAGAEVKVIDEEKAPTDESSDASITALSPEEYEDHADNKAEKPEKETEGADREPTSTAPTLSDNAVKYLLEKEEPPTESPEEKKDPPETRKAENRRRRQPRDTKEDPGEETKPGEQAELEMSDDDQILIQEGVTALTKWRGNPMIAAKLKNNPAYTESANAIDTMLKNSNALTAKDTAEYIKVLLDGFAKIEGGQVAMVAQNEIITNCNMLTKVLVSLGVDFGDLMPK